MNLNLSTPLTEIPFAFPQTLFEEAFLFPPVAFQHEKTLENSAISDLVTFSGFHPDHVLQRLKQFLKFESMIKYQKTNEDPLYVFLEPKLLSKKFTANFVFWNDVIETAEFFKTYENRDLVFVSSTPSRAYSAAMHLREKGKQRIYYLETARANF